jgi:hypothetical protein
MDGNKKLQADTNITPYITEGVTLKTHINRFLEITGNTSV